MDMQIGEAGDPMMAHIALTRVKNRQGLFCIDPSMPLHTKKVPSLGEVCCCVFGTGKTLTGPSFAPSAGKRGSAWNAGSKNQSQRTQQGNGSGQTQTESARNACVDTRKPTSRCSAMHARVGSKRMLWQRSTLPTNAMAAGSARGRPSFRRMAWKRKRGKERLCKSCASTWKGFWTCSTCRGRNGKQVRDACQRNKGKQSSVARAAVTVRAWHKRAAERRRTRLVAEVWSEIAQRQAAAGSREGPSRTVPRLAERTRGRAAYTSPALAEADVWISAAAVDISFVSRTASW